MNNINCYPLLFKKRVVLCKNNYNGIKISDITNIFNISKSSLYNWNNLNKNNKLIEKKEYKRKSKITPEIRAYIRNYVIQRINFNYKQLIKNIKKKFKIDIKKSYLYKIIKSMNITRKKIYHRFIQTTRKIRAQQIKAFKKKINNLPMKDIISIDETSIDSHINHNYGWGLKGEKIKVKCKHKRIRYTVICAIDDNKVLHFKIIKDSANGESFLNFIKDLVQNKIHPNKKKYLLLDNARIHHYKPLKKYVNNVKNIEFIYNVPYSPESNPIEQVFNESKKYIRDKGITNKNIIKRIYLSFKKISKNNIKNYYRKSLNFY